MFAPCSWGGLGLTPTGAQTLWSECEATLRSEVELDKFLDGVEDFSRRAVYPTPTVIE